MNKFNSIKTFGYNWLNKIKYNSEYDVKLVQLLTRIGPRPIVLDKNKVQIAVLENSFDVIIDQEVAGIDEISFSIPMTDSKRELIANEGFVQMFDDVYVIREVIDKKKDRVTEVFAEALWYDLQYTEPMKITSWETKDAKQMISDMLLGTGWKVGTVSFTNKRTLRLEQVDENTLGALRKVEDLFQGELWFDTQAKTVSLLDKNGIETGASVQYEKNADEIEAYYDTRDLITKIYLYGKENLTIADANNGVTFLENYTYSSTKRVQIVKDERYTNPFQLKEMGDKALAELCKPRTSYSVKMGELADRQGLDHEMFVIGGIVRMYDKELKLDQNTRIMKWSYNVIEPWKTTFDLETKVKTLSELLTGADGGLEVFDSADSVDKAEMLDLSVFNYLMNSRGDDGFSYWTNTGWTIDPVNGYSGNASFKAIGEKGREKILSQTFRPSTRDTYALSFRAYADSIQPGTNAKIGVEVIVKYEDGTQDEPKFIPLVT